MLTFLFILGLTPTVSDTFAIAVLGLAGSFIVQGIKKIVGPSLEGTKAFLTTVITSVLLGVLGVWATGGLALGFAPAILAILGTATVVYQFLIKHLPEFKLDNGTTTIV